MVINLNQYGMTREIVGRYVKSDTTEEEAINLVSRLVQMTCSPVLVVFYYVGEIVGYTPEICRRIGVLREFYCVTSVENAKEGAPV